MNPRVYDASSTVEEVEKARCRHDFLYPPTEKIPVLEVDNFPLLGKLAALRFVEWVLKNPDGVVSLPTGKTPEHFITWVMRILEHWKTPEIRSLLDEYGINRSKKPSMENLVFVQIDEFYPMDARQQNSFFYYVNTYYLKGFGIPAERTLLIDATSLGMPPGRTTAELFPGNIVDLTLRVRKPFGDLERLQKDAINRIDEFCMDYESRIRDLGGIGFFLGGIGPDGHIAFNVQGSSIHSVTRLLQTNYETQAAAAADLGGIEISRNRLVITIGLATITHNPGVTAVIIASGDAKAEVVARAVESRKNPQHPASVLQDIPNARFYLTRGAASRLVERRFHDFRSMDRISDEQADGIVIALALSRQKSFAELTADDFRQDRFARELVERTGENGRTLAQNARRRMESKIVKGLEPLSHTVFLHTEPHHDDIMLSYLAHIYHLVRDATNIHHFANLTSGFTSVTNAYTLSIIEKLERHLETGLLADLLETDYFDPKNQANRMADVYLYLDGVAAKRPEGRDKAEACRLLRNLFDVYRSTDLLNVRLRLKALHEYFTSQYPGAKDPPDVQTIKGTIREWEVELLWAYFGIESSSIFPLRLGFYTGDIFSPEPREDRDAAPIYKLIKKLKPDVVTVAFDPEGSGPDTHYKALQAVAAALKRLEADQSPLSIRIWGYRNVWYRFRPEEANLYVPVSLNSLSLLHTAFMNCFGSQRAASFPSHEHDGPFSELAQRIQVEQIGIVRTCLGFDHFHKNRHPRLRAARGMIFLKEMTLPEFYEKVRKLRKLTEMDDAHFG